MPTSKEYLTYILEQIRNPEEITYRQMMGEYLLYYRGTLIGGLYDNRLLIKPTPAARSFLSSAPHEEPYPGAKPLLLVEDIDDSEHLIQLFCTLSEETISPEKE